MITEKLKTDLERIVDNSDKLIAKIPELSASEVEQLLKKICVAINDAHELCAKNTDKLWEENIKQ